MLLVTGANGFVGRVVCRYALEAGFKVRGSVRGSDKSYPDMYPLTPLFSRGEESHPGPSGTLVSRDFEAPQREGRNIEKVVVGELGVDADWAPALEGVGAVVHLAGRVHIMKDFAVDPLAEFRKVNVEGTERLAVASAAAGVKRFVFLSSIKVYGEDMPSGPLKKAQIKAFTEEDIPNPQDPYAISKWEAEQVLHKISKETGMEVVIIRPPLVYGPGVRANFLRLLRMVERGIPLPHGAIRNQRSLVYVKNLVDGIISCVRHPDAAGKTFLVSDGEDVSTPDLIRLIGSSMGKKCLLFNVSPKLLLYLSKVIGLEASIQRLTGSLVVDSSCIRRELGWTPPYSLTQGMQETVDWYLRQRNSH